MSSVISETIKDYDMEKHKSLRGKNVNQGSHDRGRANQMQLRYRLTTNQNGYLELNLSNLSLTDVPRNITNFTRLQVLNLSHNALQDLPGSLARIRKLQILLLYGNKLSSIPETLTNCTHLKEIDLTHNKLSKLPRNIAALHNLQILRLGQNKFENLPHDISQLKNLQCLDLHGNRLWYLPFSIQMMTKLRYLNLADNKFEHLPIPVCQVTSLKVLNLRGNYLVNLAPDFESLQQLREINLAFNRLQTIPLAIATLQDLRYLNLAGNKIKYVPHHFVSLPQLRVLHLQGNNLEHFASGFPMMHYLNVADNNLYNLPIIHMKKLRHLNVNSNRLENLPQGMLSLKNLETVKANGNKIKYIPQDIVNLKKLRVLDLGNNEITSFPQVIDQMRRLDFFNVKGNNINHRSSFQSQIWPQTFKTERVPRDFSKTIARDDLKIPKKADNSVATRTSSRKQKSQDLDELLQNGFSMRHIQNNYGSVMKLEKEQSLASRSGKRYFDLDGETDIVGMSTMPASEVTDFKLLGICNQVEMLLNKQLLQPVLSLKRHQEGKSFIDKNIVPVADGLWRLSDHRSNPMMGVILSRSETFTITEAGGEFISSADPKVSVTIPSKTVTKTIQAHMKESGSFIYLDNLLGNKGIWINQAPLHIVLYREKIVKIEQAMLNTLKAENSMIANIISIGPIVFLNADSQDELRHLVIITLPPPPGEGKGHLNIVTIKEDNSCVPVSIGFRHRNGYITVNSWRLSGKTAVMTKAKCKYKACKSVEQILSRIQQPGIPANEY